MKYLALGYEYAVSCYSSNDHVPIVRSYPNATKKLYLFLIFMTLLGFHNFREADLNNDLLARNKSLRYQFLYSFEQTDNAKQYLTD